MNVKRLEKAMTAAVGTKMDRKNRNMRNILKDAIAGAVKAVVVRDDEQGYLRAPNFTPQSIQTPFGIHRFQPQ